MSQTQTPQIERRNMFENATIVKLTLGRPGNRKKLSSQMVEVEADKAMIHVSKDLLDSAEYKDVVKKDGEIRRTLSDLALPSPLGSGSYLIAHGLVREAHGTLTRQLAERRALIEVVRQRYPERKAEARIRLNGTYNEADYPSVEGYVEAFTMTWQFMSFGVDQALEAISQEIFESEREKFNNQLQDSYQTVIQALRATFKGLIDAMVEKTQTGPDGKHKIFRDTLVTNMTDFFRTFAPKNGVVNDEQLETLVGQAQRILEGVEADTLRDNDSIRNYVNAQLTQVQLNLDSLVTTRSRAMRLDDEEAA